MRKKDEIKDIKEKIHQLRMEKAINELKKEVDRFKKADTFARSFASCFKRRKKINNKRTKKIKRRKTKSCCDCDCDL